MKGGPTEFDRARSIRAVLTATGAGVYLCTHVAGPVPAETMAAVHESDEMESRVGRAGPGRADDLDQREKEARAVAAAAVKGSPERVVLTHGVADAARRTTLEILAQRRTTDEAARILVLDGTPPSVVGAVRGVAAACGAIVEGLAQAPQIIAADVALVVMAHVDDVGAVTAVRPVGDAARNAGARLVVDASLSVGAIPVEVTALGADVVVADTHRWLLGPEGMALAWLTPELGDDAPGRLRDASDPMGRGALLALSRSVGWLLMYVELPWAVARTEELSQRLYEALEAIDGVELPVALAGLPGDVAARSALASFSIAGWDAEQAADELARSVFAILDIDDERDLVRASVGAWNLEEELDRFAARVAELAEHTPETLPRRPSLTVISGPTDLAADD